MPINYERGCSAIVCNFIQSLQLAREGAEAFSRITADIVFGSFDRQLTMGKNQYTKCRRIAFLRSIHTKIVQLSCHLCQQETHRANAGNYAVIAYQVTLGIAVVSARTRNEKTRACTRARCVHSTIDPLWLRCCTVSVCLRHISHSR